jgi:hypothetical protein
VVAKTNDELVALALEELRSGLPGSPRGGGSRAVGGARAQGDLLRGARRAGAARGPDGHPGLFLAGDWIGNDLPATIEGAVTSGHAAAARPRGTSSCERRPVVRRPLPGDRTQGEEPALVPGAARTQPAARRADLPGTQVQRAHGPARGRARPGVPPDASPIASATPSASPTSRSRAACRSISTASPTRAARPRRPTCEPSASPRAAPTSAIPLSSPQIEREVGGRIKAARGWRVDLEKPEIDVRLEFLSNEAFYFFDKQAGPGGMPIGTRAASVCLLSGGIDSPVAAWRMMKRGCTVTFVHFHSYPILSRARSRRRARWPRC